MAKTVFLTGGSSGIGKAITQKLAKDGWRILAPTHQQLDMSDLNQVIQYTSSADFPAQEIKAMIHVAGIWHDQDAALANKQFGNFSPDQIAQTINVGLTGFMLLANRLLAHGQPSHIVGISGTFESGGKGWLPYYTSKRALEDFLVGLAQDYPRLAVYGISPADTATPAYKRFYPEFADSAQPPEVAAELVTSLLDGKSNFASGNVIELRDGKQKPGFHS